MTKYFTTYGTIMQTARSISNLYYTNCMLLFMSNKQKKKKGQIIYIILNPFLEYAIFMFLVFFSINIIENFFNVHVIPKRYLSGAFINCNMQIVAKCSCLPIIIVIEVWSVRCTVQIKFIIQFVQHNPIHYGRKLCFLNGKCADKHFKLNIS